MPRLLSIVADSSFYLCFLDDIKRDDILSVILNQFLFHLPPKVFDEVSASQNFSQVRSNGNLIKVNERYNYGEILKPFFSKKQVEKGEAESIALAYVWHRANRCDKLILDDGEARSFVEANISSLKAIMIGTVGFIGDCHCVFSIFNKDKALELLHLIKGSLFRIKDKDLNNVKQRIEGC